MNTQIVYIMGRGHSGSTVLDLLLGNSPDIESVGELVSGMGRYDEQCSCGSPFGNCMYWQAVRSAFERSSQIAWEQAVAATTRQAHIRKFISTLFSPKNSPSIQELYKVTTAVIDAIRETSKKKSW